VLLVRLEVQHTQAVDQIYERPCNLSAMLPQAR
jgi:hypothetical protein